jgi:3-oxoadipate enol-lactonase
MSCIHIDDIVGIFLLALDRDAAGVLDTFGLKSAHLVGMSMGGGIAIDFAISFPEALKTLTVIPGGFSGYEYEDPQLEAEFQKIAEAAKQGDLAVATKLLLEFEPMRPAASKPELYARLHEIISDYAWSHYRQEYSYASMDPPAINRLSDISVPTLVIVGDLDIADHQNQARILRDRIPNAELVEIKGAGHMVNMEAPDEFNRALLEFLTR